jgi:hypothetical protein
MHFKKSIYFSAGNFNKNDNGLAIELRGFQMPEAANSEEIHLGNGPRHLWNVRPKTTQKGLHENIGT